MKDTLNSTMLDLNDFVSDVAGYRLFVATAKEQMTEEAFQQQLQGWVDQVKKYKEYAQLHNGKTYHTAVVVDILFKMIDQNDQTIEEKEMGKAWLVMAMFEMEPVLREEILNEKGGAA